MIDLNEIFTIDLYPQKYEGIKDCKNFTIKEVIKYGKLANKWQT